MIILSPMPTLIAITIASILFVSGGSLSFAVFIAALLVSTGMADALMPLMWASEFIKKSQAAAIRIHEIMDLPELKRSSLFKSQLSSILFLTTSHLSIMKKILMR